MKKEVSSPKSSDPTMKDVYETRSPIDRRSAVDRRVVDMGPGYPGTERRINIKDRRRGREDRYGWKRDSRWSSTPIYPDLP